MSFSQFHNPIINQQETHHTYSHQPMQDYLPSHNDFYFSATVQPGRPSFSTNDPQASSDSQETPEHHSNDALSSYSGSYSSSKYSTDMPYSTETDKRDPNSKVTPIIRKGIHKYYEPIVDGKTVFKYEDDPNEYKKARKRIQNRESATRVRNRKKTYVEELEDEMNALRSTQTDMGKKLNCLQSENLILRQQLAQFEKLLAMNSQPNYQPPQQQVPQQNEINLDEFFVPVAKQSSNYIGQDEVYYNDYNQQMNPQIDFGFYRQAPPKNLKTHIGILGVVTMLICVSFISTAAGHLNGVNTGTTQVTLATGNATLISTPLSNLASSNVSLPQIPTTYGWNTVFEYLMKIVYAFTTGIYSLPTFAQYMFGMVYTGYAVYVVVLLNWAYIVKNLKKQ